MTGAELRAWRLSRNMMSRGLATWLGLTPEYISRLENGAFPVQSWMPLALDGIDVARVRMALNGEPLR